MKMEIIWNPQKPALWQRWNTSTGLSLINFGTPRILNATMDKDMQKEIYGLHI